MFIINAMISIFNFCKTPLFPILTLGLLLVGCGKEEHTEDPSDPGSKRAALKEALTPGSEKTSFLAVADELDLGGQFFFYLSTEAWLRDLSQTMDEWMDLLVEAAREENGEVPPEVERFRETLLEVVRSSGVEELTGVGMSSIKLEPTFHRTNLFLHHHPGTGKGWFWSLLGRESNQIPGLHLLPETTTMAAFQRFSPARAWAALQAEIERLELEELQEGLLMLDMQAQMMAGLGLETFFSSLGDEFGMLLSLDSDRKMVIQNDRGDSMEIDYPALAMVTKVEDETIFRQLANMMQGMGAGTEETPAPGWQTVKTPLPPLFTPEPLTLSVNLFGNYLVIATDDQLVEEIHGLVEGNSGQGLADTERFQRLARNMPDQGYAAFFSDGRLEPVIHELQAKLSDPAMASPVIFEEMMEKLRGQSGPTDFYSVGTLIDQGVLVRTQGNVDARYLAAPLMIGPGLLLAGGIFPAVFSNNFFGAGITVDDELGAQSGAVLGGIQATEDTGVDVDADRKAEATTVLNELRIIDGAKDQYAIQNNRPGSDEASWEMLTDYFRPGSDLAERSEPTDALGHPVDLRTFDELPQLSPETYRSFTDVVDETFWGRFYEAE